MRAQVRDTTDSISDEVDVVTCNEYRPFPSAEGHLYSLRVSTDFVVQVKAIARSEGLPRLVNNCTNIKRLKRVWPQNRSSTIRSARPRRRGSGLRS
jgi:hypothetical protein